MDVYKIDACGLSTYVKNKQELINVQKLKKANADLLSIDNKYIPVLCFNETLDIVNENKEVLGEFVGKIRTCNSNTNSASININLNSTAISEYDEKIGINLMTNTTTNFQSYEEKWSQWRSKNSEITCKKVLISNRDSSGKIQICTELNNNGELIDQTKNMNLKHVKHLHTEGMNYAFLRYLAIIGFEGTIKNKTSVTINGILCKTVYECSPLENYEINKIIIPVVIIKRILYGEKTSIIQMTTILTRSGYTLKHSWNKITSKELTIKKSMQITKDGIVCNDTMIYLKNHWDQDIRFKSLYLDKVSEMKLKYKNYLKNNEAVKNLIIDYIKEVLLTKPDNILQFSINYFEELK